MTTQTVYIAIDGTKFLDKDVCLEYEAERIKLPTEPGIRFYNRFGEEIDINHINEMAYYVITNTIIARAILNKIRIFGIKQHYPLFTECGHYMITTDGYFRIEQDLFDETMSKLRGNTIFAGDKAISRVVDNPADIDNKPNINIPPADNQDIIEGFVESVKSDS